MAQETGSILNPDGTRAASNMASSPDIMGLVTTIVTKLGLPGLALVGAYMLTTNALMKIDRVESEVRDLRMVQQESLKQDVVQTELLRQLVAK